MNDLYEPEPPDPPPGYSLPAGFNREWFNEDQLVYLEDEIQSVKQQFILRLFELLNVAPRRKNPTPRTIFINAAVIANLLGINDAQFSLKEIANEIGVDQRTVRYHYDAILELLKIEKL